MKKLRGFLLGLDLFFVCIAAGKAVFSLLPQITGGKEPPAVQIGGTAWEDADPGTKDLTKKKVALTFDDGPNALYTQTLLDGLKERGVHATFFLLGKEAERFPGIVKNMHEDGHLIGNHSYEHVNLSNLSDEAAILQVDQTNEAIYQITGEYPEYIRPPYGCWKSNLDYQTTMIEVLWNIDPRDWKTDNAKAVAERVLKQVEEDDIILLHDASESSVEAAFRIIDVLLLSGYEFVTVDEILFN